MNLQIHRQPEAGHNVQELDDLFSQPDYSSMVLKVFDDPESEPILLRHHQNCVPIPKHVHPGVQSLPLIDYEPGFHFPESELPTL